jgi:hypothetical protein
VASEPRPQVAYGAAPAAAAPPPPTYPAPVADGPGNAPSDDKPFRPYWRALLVWGVIVIVVGWVILYAGLHQAATDVGNGYFSDSNAGSDGAEVLAGTLLAFCGSVMLIPGLIGWGIHASGLTRR